MAELESRKRKRTRASQREGQPSRRRYAVGEASRERILEAAERVLSRDGYHAFSTRRVAQECSISAGNLTYYFPTKSSLIEALMEGIYVRYDRRYAELRSAESQNSPDWLTEQLTEMLWDATDPEATGLFVELWVMARHHGFGAELANRYYERFAHAIAEALSKQYPDLSKQELLKVAYFVTIFADGIAAAFSRLEDCSVGSDEIIPLALEAIQGLLNHPRDGV
jgi:AcrR family transcriptional regulator